MPEPKNCKCECHVEEEKEVKHPPHVYGPGYYWVENGKRTHISICQVKPCGHRKEVSA